MELIRIDRTLLANIEGNTYNKTFNSTREAIDAEKEIRNAGKDKALEFFKPEKTSREVQIEIEYNEQLEKAKEIEDILDFMKDVRDNGHDLFEVRENSIYMKGINISMPELLVREIANAEDDEQLDSLINFWSLCAMNPDARARHDLFEFLKGGKFSLTQQGFFVAYRNAEIKSADNKDLQDFIVKTWIHTKAVTKKSPADYAIIKDNNQYKRVHINVAVGTDNIIGNLAKLYDNLDQVAKVTYTDAHTGTMTIKIGEPVSQAREQCDADPEADCSRGLHVGNKAFLSRGYFGAEGLVVLVNPRNVVAVPHYNENKMRVCEYLPISVAEYDDEGYLLELDSATLDYDLGEDVLEEIGDILEMSNSEFEEYKLNSFISPEITLESLSNIYNAIDLTINEANDIVKARTL